MVRGAGIRVVVMPFTAGFVQIACLNVDCERQLSSNTQLWQLICVDGTTGGWLSVAAPDAN
jgi:hypothetical protein